MRWRVVPLDVIDDEVYLQVQFKAGFWSGWKVVKVYDENGNYLKMSATDDQITAAISRFIRSTMRTEAAYDAARNFMPQHYLSTEAKVHRDSMDYAP